MHETLRSHLDSLYHLEGTYVSYNLAYEHLLLELDRRRKRRDAVDSIVQGMVAQLEGFRDGG